MKERGEAKEGQALLQSMDAKIPAMIMLVVPGPKERAKGTADCIRTIYANPLTTWHRHDIEGRELAWPEGVAPPVIYKQYTNDPAYLEPVEEYELEYTAEMRERDLLLRMAYQKGFQDGCAAYAEALDDG